MITTSMSTTTMNKSISFQSLPYQIHLQNDSLRKGYIDKLYPFVGSVMHRNILFSYNEHKERGWLYRSLREIGPTISNCDGSATIKFRPTILR